MKEEKHDLRKRTKAFALRVIKLYTALPAKNPARVLGNQLLRSGTSVGANYAEAVRARSDADFINKHHACLQELEETLYWLDLLTDGEFIKPSRIQPLKDEVNELIAIFVTIINRTKRRSKAP
jgi:four helix bundle protein